MSGLSEADDCPLCGGCGEIQATDQNCKTDQYGCPLCMSADHAETVAGLRAQLTTARMAGVRVGLAISATTCDLERGKNLASAILTENARVRLKLQIASDAFEDAGNLIRAIPDAEILKALEGV